MPSHSHLTKSTTTSYNSWWKKKKNNNYVCSRLFHVSIARNAMRTYVYRSTKKIVDALKRKILDNQGAQQQPVRGLWQNSLCGGVPAQTLLQFDHTSVVVDIRQVGDRIPGVFFCLFLFEGYLLVFVPVLRAFVFECLLGQDLPFPIIRRSSRGVQGSD